MGVLDNAPVVAKDHYGLYMILETLHARRHLKLIYVGIVKSDRRDLLTRMSEHRADWLGKIARNQIFVKFGVVETYGKLDAQLIEDVESVIVFGAQPRENTSKKQSYSLYQDVVVENINHEGFLKKTYDSARQRKMGA
jgi:hypothetical protein